MPYGPFHRQTPEYHKKLEQRALRQTLGSDYPAFEWLEQMLDRLNAIPAYDGFEEKDVDDLEKGRHILRQLCRKAGFDPSQPRVPAGNSDGGEWTDTGGGGGRPIDRSPHRPRDTIGHGRFRAPKPNNPLLQDIADRNRGLPPKKPLDDLLEGGGGRGGYSYPGSRGGAKPSSSPRESEYLKETRKLPEGVHETGRGADRLTPQQAQKLEGWQRKNNNYKNQYGTEMEVTTYSDGRAIYSFKIPGKVPGSYRINEKHVAPTGETMRVYGVNIDPQGNLIHVKPKEITDSKKVMIDLTALSKGYRYMKTRKELLQDLLQFNEPSQLPSLREELGIYGWDSDEYLATLTEDMVVSILQRYLSGALTRQQVADWAWAVEGREDISVGNEAGNNQDLFFALAELANPETEGNLTTEGAQKLIAQLRSIPVSR